MKRLVIPIEPDLINKYDLKGPYYTSYPTGKVWAETFNSLAYSDALQALAQEPEITPLALYFHIPFCVRLCRFCFCYTTVTSQSEKIDSFLDALFQEIQLLRKFLDTSGQHMEIREIHLGGGSPSCLTDKQFARLMTQINSIVNPARLAEFTMEIDAITVTPDKLRFFHEAGITRLSFGIQDFDPRVQKAIGRVQSPQLLADLLDLGIRTLFRSINFDLMYGLPLQTHESFRETLAMVIGLAPDRLAIYSYFHQPEVYKHQAFIAVEDLPGVLENTRIFVEAVETLTASGYESIGIDHFARPEDDLTQAKYNRTLGRHFMGYTAGRTPHLIGLGPSSLSGFCQYYAQNVYAHDEYCATLAQGSWPILRGYCLSANDVVRRDVINEILCYFEWDLAAFARHYQLDIHVYFREELKRLKPLADDGIIEWIGDKMRLTPRGWLFARQVSSIFDSYLSSENRGAYTPVIQRSSTSDYLRLGVNMD